MFRIDVFPTVLRSEIVARNYLMRISWKRKTPAARNGNQLSIRSDPPLSLLGRDTR